ncbi:immunity protein Tsi6 family protein [Pseudomonas sp. R3-18-08]|uniref:immunity protein Tsi6 family protein n=1 Tax=Pseudomonas sp. R3-18-08 TaxID=1173283 RepID=UPI000F575BF6|nr:immunity protein Tsi6 family protein [Pseudomonas sp. R3-18-08]AZF13697.1 Phosphoglycerate dehydrogenase [Pseudomonas sp. R3-18-08]
MKLATPLAYVQKAIELTVDRRNRCPQFPVYDLLLKQLDYVKAVFEGSETDKSKLHQLSIGAIASKEFEENDPELARALKDAFYVAIQSARGLKIQLPD